MRSIEPPIDISLNIQTVERPPTWRKEVYTLSYMLVDREVDASELLTLLQWAGTLDIPNPRVITPGLIRWSSLFHPRFYHAIRKTTPRVAEPLAWRDGRLPTSFSELSRLWLQSILFLSGVTLSAAIIQRRFSSGTIGSKLDRLWDAGTLAKVGLAPELAPLELHQRVSELAKGNAGETGRLLCIRTLFMNALELIAPKAGTIEPMQQSTPTAFSDGRFGFIDLLRDKLGKNLRSIVVYGSSVSSKQFADIDALVVVDNPVSALHSFAGTSPVWQGKELNIGIYSPHELLVMQRLSGDNLADYGICLWGETEVIRKSIPALLARNFSFGIVRQRQQLGMLSREATSNDHHDPDRQNLYEYFVKIPANVTKGTFGAAGTRLAKEDVHEWLDSEIGFDTAASQHQAAKGNILDALASSALATGKALSALDSTFGVIRP